MIIPAGFAQANIRFTGTAAPSGAEVTIGINLANNLADPATNANLILGRFQSALIRARVPGALVISSCLLKYGPNDTGPAAEFVGPLAGTNGGAAFAPNTSVLIRKNTSTGGRRGRGRMFFPGCPEGDVGADGIIVPAILALWQTAFTALRDGLVTDNLAPVLLHGGSGVVPLPMTITSLTVDSKVATQRRRLRR